MKESEDGNGWRFPKREMQVLRKRSVSTCSSLTYPVLYAKERMQLSLPGGYEYRSPGFSESENRKTCASAAMTAGHLERVVQKQSLCAEDGGTRTEYGREGTLDALSEVRKSYFSPNYPR